MVQISRLHQLSVLSVRKVHCGKMAEQLGMPFRVVNGVGQGMGVLDGVVIVKGKGQFWV